jgi:hypothetical protein
MHFAKLVASPPDLANHDQIKPESCYLSDSPPIGTISAKPTAPGDRMTRYSLSRRIKLSRLAPPSELIERRTTCGISGLTEGGNMAPSLHDDLKFYLLKRVCVTTPTDTV